MMCSARSLGCAISSAVSRRSCSAIAGARARAGDGPRRNVAALRLRSRRSGDDERMLMSAKLHAGGERRGVGAAQCRVHQCRVVAAIAQPQPPGAREVRLVDVAGGDVFLARAARVPGTAPATPPPSDRRSGCRRLRARGWPRGRLQLGDEPRMCWPHRHPVRPRTRVSVARSWTARCSHAQRERRVRRRRRRQAQTPARFPRPAS